MSYNISLVYIERLFMPQIQGLNVSGSSFTAHEKEVLEYLTKTETTSFNAKNGLVAFKGKNTSLVKQKEIERDDSGLPIHDSYQRNGKIFYNYQKQDGTYVSLEHGVKPQLGMKQVFKMKEVLVEREFELSKDITVRDVYYVVCKVNRALSAAVDGAIDLVGRREGFFAILNNPEDPVSQNTFNDARMMQSQCIRFSGSVDQSSISINESLESMNAKAAFALQLEQNLVTAAQDDGIRLFAAQGARTDLASNEATNRAQDRQNEIAANHARLEQETLEQTAAIQGRLSQERDACSAKLIQERENGATVIQAALAEEQNVMKRAQEENEAAMRKSFPDCDLPLARESTPEQDLLPVAHTSEAIQLVDTSEKLQVAQSAHEKDRDIHVITAPSQQEAMESLEDQNVIMRIMRMLMAYFINKSASVEITPTCSTKVAPPNGVGHAFGGIAQQEVA